MRTRAPTSRRPRRAAYAAIVVSSSALFVAPGVALAQTSVGECLAAAEQGQTLRDSGAYRHARDRFVVCAGDECPGEVRKRCVDWLGDLEEITPTVVFGAVENGKEVADVRVIVDGEPAVERLDGKPFAVDPGEHRFRFERTGADAVERTAVVLAGEKQRLVTVHFGPPPVLPMPAASDSPPPAARARRGLAYTLGALGVAELVAGASLDVSGLVFLGQCNGDPSCSRAHEIAEVQWRFVAGDILLGVGALSCVATWLLSRDIPDRSAAGARPTVSVDVAPTRMGARFGLTSTF